MPAFFSIIIPTYNRAHLIGATLRSVLEQTFKDFEILVVDDGSTDETGAIVRKFTDDRITYLKKDNAERAAARNFGTKHATGMYINFFDSDDLMLPHHLQTAYDFIQSENQPEWLHLAYDFRDERGKLLSEKKEFNDETSDVLLFDNVLSCNGVVVRKDIAVAFPFCEERKLSSSEDWQLWVRLLCRFPLCFVNTVTSTVVTHDMRSLNTIRAEALVERDEVLIKTLGEDSVVMKKYGNRFQRFVADRYSFFMLKYSETGNTPKVLFWASRAIRAYFPVIFTRRYLASLRNVLTK